MCPCCLVKMQRGCVWELCVRRGGGGIIASRDAAGPLLRREPMTLKSCAPRLPNNRPSAWNQTPLPPSAPSSLFLTGLRQRGLPGDNWGRKSTSFIFQVPQSFNPPTPPPHHHHPPFTAPRRYFTPDIDLYFKTTTEPHVPPLSWHERFVEMGSDIADNWRSPAPPPPRLSHPYIRTDKQCFCFAMQSRVLLCAFLVFEHAHDQTHVPHTVSRECLFPSATILRKKSIAMHLWLRWGSMQSLTWYSNSFNIYRTILPHEIAPVVVYFFIFFWKKLISVLCMMMDAFKAVVEVY